MDVGVIGVGSMGRNHVRVYSELKSVTSLRVFDLYQALAKEVATKHDAERCGSAEELLKEVDAVNICVPTPYHFKVAGLALAEEVPLLIEKPLCASSEEARRLIAKAPEGLVAGVGHIERFNPIVDELRRIIKKPLYVEAKRHNPSSARVTGSSVVEDLMIHDIDLVFNLLLNGDCRVQSVGNHDVCSALFDFQGTPVYLSASRKSSKKIRMIYIEEEEFTIEGDFMTQEVFIHRKPGQYRIEDERYVQENIIEKVMVNKQEPLKRELATFIECVKTGNQFPIPLAQGLRNLEICEQIAEAFGGDRPGACSP